MKKSLVLAMAMALGVTASAYAANPFSDVPAGHWAYDSIDKLAAAGVIDGMGDGTYQGDKTMTRYEMAQIVAKAMAKGANVDKLAAEFADELDNLGVRVANLEKKADNVTIAGKLRYRYVDKEIKENGKKTSGNSGTWRTRLYLTGKVNEDWAYNAMLQNTQYITGDDDSDPVVAGQGKGEENLKFKHAYVTGKLGGAAVTAGRFNPVFAEGNGYDVNADAIMLNYGSKIKVEAMYGRVNEGGDKGKVAQITVSAPVAKNLDLSAGYLAAKEMEAADKKQDIAFVGAHYGIDSVALSAMYMHGKVKGEGFAAEKDEQKKNGFVIGLDYKGADMAKPGSWGAWAKYYNQGNATFFEENHTTDANTFGMADGGFKGVGIAANYTFAKNIKGEVAYYNTKAKITDKKDHRIVADLHFEF